MIDNREKYKEICSRHSSIPLFMQYWWMEASCGHDWNVLISSDSAADVCGVLVFHYVKRYGKLLIVPALLTQYSGTWLFYPDNLTTEARYSFENKTYNDLIKQLELLKPDLFELNFHYSQKYWQPFYWSGYSQTTRYTYRIEDISNINSVFEGMSHRKRQKPLAKASGEFEFRLDLNASDFYDAYAAQLKAEGKKILYSKELFLKIYEASQQMGQGQIFSLYSKSGELATALFVVWDSNSAYNLVIHINDKFRSSGATTLIVYDVIEYVSSKTRSYDFEGSMIQGVALKNQSFGAAMVPFSQISKINSPILKIWRTLKD